MKPSLQLTFLPARYWTTKHSQFKILSKAESPPKDAGFFILWLSPSQSIEDLEIETQRIFPGIPVKKLLTCEVLVGQQHDKSSLPSSSSINLGKVQAKIIPIPPAIKLLFQLQIIENQDRTRQIVNYSESIKIWAYLTKFTVELLSRGNFIPILEAVEKSEKVFEGRWRVILKNEYDHTRFNNLIRNSPWACYNLPINFIPSQNSHWSTTGLWHPSFLFSHYMDTIADYLIRTSLNKGFYERFSQIYGSSFEDLENACAIDQKTAWDLRFLNACIGKTKRFEISRFCDTPVPGILRNWVQNVEGFSFALGVTFTLRLEYPKTPESDWTLAFYIQPLHDSTQFIPLKDIWSGTITYKEEFANACDEENALQEQILRALGTASRFFPPILRSLESKNPQYVKLNATEVMDFLRYSMYLLIQAGFHIELPNQFKEQGQQRLTARMVIRPKAEGKTQRAAKGEGGTPVPVFDLNSMLEYKWEAQLEGKPLTEKEFLELANSREPLIFWRGQWVLVDQQDMDTLRPIFEKQTSESDMQLSGTISTSDALKLGMIGAVQLQGDGTKFEVAVEGDFQWVLNQLQNIDSFEQIPVPSSFTGTLRPYQEKALMWLGNMAQLHFGVCLADDMGLGKTVEIISFLAHRKENYPHDGSILIICPTSVLFNWARELKKFSPTLDVFINHGADRVKDNEVLQEFTKPHRIILTTYGTIRNDIELLEPIVFTGVIVDESQNIKNYKTQQTQAIYRLKSQYRVCMSGTPIENRLLELWTLFQFLNPGLLGNRTEFQNKFVIPIERFHDEHTASNLRKFISPFILRRVKSDKNIIQDLPEKNEMKVYLELSEEQAQLYTEIVNRTLKEIQNLETKDLRRRGLVLSLLTKTKQICNHPFQYLHIDLSKAEIIGDKNQKANGTKKSTKTKKSTAQKSNDDEKDSSALENLISEYTDQSLAEPHLLELSQLTLDEITLSSQKLSRLIEMIDEILEEGEKILIFTQFKQMGDILQTVLEKKYNFPILFFHGGVPEKKRREIVDDFQSDALDSSPILILSLKAGGTGLNLTKASTVFHFDRWWNPAVENQATDRAYRIGQTNQVNVYKFVSVGTIEEKIDQILEEKRNLADQIITSSGENWITNLSNDDLKELFSLTKTTY